jgi:hypothetical protein
MKQRKNYKNRFPVGAGNDVGEVEFFSYPFKFFRLINKTASRQCGKSGNPASSGIIEAIEKHT